ncbi:Glucan endo-1-3-beta-D-glucosidase [Nymphaea thermarum]|nr:Glucan endo-1-3-beta-D-glucosidase [Nymphaea thermarum]
MAATPAVSSVLALVLLLVIASECSASMANEQNAGHTTWCVAKPSSDDNTLLNNIHFSCSQPHVDCGILQKGCPCNIPDTLINHASVAMNLYYQAYGRNPWNCHFGGSGLLAFTNPSYGSCIYS